MRLNRQIKRRHTRRKFLIGFFSLLTITAVSTKLSLANADVAGLVESWFQNKAEIVINDMDRQINLETDIQKQRLVKEIELRMAASNESINRFTEEQKLLYKNQLQSYADQLIANLDFSDEEDTRRIEASLETILSTACAAMDELAQNYTPPAVEQPTPEQPEEAAPATEIPVPAAPEEPSVETGEPAPTELPAVDGTDAPASTEQPETDTQTPAPSQTDTQAPAPETEPPSNAAAPVTIND